jgi:hypothetical protein
MATLHKLYERLKLRVNEAKSAVDRVWKRKLLGLSFWSGRGIHIRVAPKSLEAMKDRIRGLTKRVCGRSMTMVCADLRSYLLGWKGYFGIAETPRKFEELDRWIRRRLRALQLKQWRRGPVIYRELRKLGLSVERSRVVAANAGRWWRNAALDVSIALPNRYFDEMGVPRLAA